MASTKMTFTLDQETAARIDRTAERLAMSKSGVVREAVRAYAERAGRLSEAERLRMVTILERIMRKPPTRSAAAVEREIAAVRRARRGGGRGTPAE